VRIEASSQISVSWSVGLLLFLASTRQQFMVAIDLASPLLANERTFLAWTRTSLALVGAGLVAARFFAGRAGAGIASVCLFFSAVFMSFATYRYFHVIQLLESGKFEVDNIGPIVIVATTLSAIVAGGVFVWFKEDQHEKLLAQSPSDNIRSQLLLQQAGETM
jgi:uncharacterized membrane protein YidH (DUF202 family)